MAQYVMLAAVAGFLIPLQALINARLGSLLTGPLSAALASFVVGLLSLCSVMALFRFPVPASSQLLATPWWAWLGGFLGAFFIYSTATAIPHLGAAGTFAAVIAAQLIAAIIFDHLGLLHAAHPIDAQRVAGAGFLLLGLYLILRPQ